MSYQFITLSPAERHRIAASRLDFVRGELERAGFLRNPRIELLEQERDALIAALGSLEELVH